MPAPNVHLDFGTAVHSLELREQERRTREDRMRNALEILAGTEPKDIGDVLRFPRFVRTTAREGLGRESETHDAA